MSRQINILSSVDWLSIVLYFVLVTFGWMNIFAVNYVHGSGSFFSIHHRYTLQLAFIIIAIFTILVIFVVDSRFFSFMAYPAYGLSILVLLVVLVIGTTVNDSKSWISLGPISIQPSEFAKVATVLTLAKFLSRYNAKPHRWKEIFYSAGIIAVPFLLILAQPDFGSAIVYGVLLLVLYREGMPGWILIVVISMVALFLGTLLISKFLLIAILTGIAILAISILNRKIIVFFVAAVAFSLFAAIFYVLARYSFFPRAKFDILLGALILSALTGLILAFAKKIRNMFLVVGFLAAAIGLIYSVDFIFHHVMEPHQRNRVNVMLGIDSDPLGYEYNVRQSKIAIGSGGFSGKGFMQGTQTKFKFVPEQSTDFIFCTVGEEWGFLGSFGLVLVYVGLLVRLIFLAERQRSRFSRIYGYGVIAILFFHFAVNLGMTIGLFPVIGIPLPFLSYGGSSLLAFTIMLFIFLRLDSTRAAYLI